MPRSAPRGGRLTEKLWLGQVLELAELYGWQHYHPWLSIHSQTGWPDLALVKPPRLVLAELKSESGKLTENQRRWINLLAMCPGIEVYVWRAPDLTHVAEILSGRSLTAQARLAVVE